MEINATSGYRPNFAVQHIIAAARFARLCYKVEDDNAGAPFGSFYDEVVSYVTATILSSVAGLEANINELFADVRDRIKIGVYPTFPKGKWLIFKGLLTSIYQRISRGC